MIKKILLIATLALAACDGDNDGGGITTSTNSTKLEITNQMSTTGAARDGVTMDGLTGSNSIGDVNQRFEFDSVNYEDDVTVSIDDDECNIFWELSPISDEVNTFGSSGGNLFVPCGETLTCTATLVQSQSLFFGQLTCE